MCSRHVFPTITGIGQIMTHRLCRPGHCLVQNVKLVFCVRDASFPWGWFVFTWLSDHISDAVTSVCQQRRSRLATSISHWWLTPAAPSRQRVDDVEALAISNVVKAAKRQICRTGSLRMPSSWCSSSRRRKKRNERKKLDEHNRKRTTSVD